ncbi:MAG: 30S ribosomal protein S12 methylthiotransferase RimO [Gammaproteobacteria bacterium]|nr:30S ribosomal protein S12 methylthiotransferase RimO [Gammaproteobacteria bacterium]
MKVGMISLGCSKNQIDSEMILGLLKRQNFEITDNEDEADLIVINTCAFIDSAKLEAIKTIDEVIENKKGDQKVVVCGCFAQRYKEVLLKEFKGVDRVISIDEYKRFASIINELFKIDEDRLSFTDRVLISPSYAPYVRIADGCNNHCAFCAIPGIRGKYLSRDMEDILEEVKILRDNGAKEINLIAQDTSKYGIDNYHKLMLPKLLDEIASIDGIKMIRMFYIYPETITDELLEVIKKHDNIAPYFDIPFQHASNKILKLMKRATTHEKASLLIEKIKREIPNAVIRTTLMVGFPHETNKDFEELLEFVKESKFFHMGAFMYSKEEGTLSHDMYMQVPEFIKRKRYDKLMKLQSEIAKELKEELIHKKLEAMVTSYDEETYTFTLRNYMFAPDDVDGAIVATCPFENDLKEGDFVEVEILGATSYELYGEIRKILS